MLSPSPVPGTNIRKKGTIMGKKRTLTEIEKIIAENAKGRPYKDGLFYPDPTPVSLPAGYERQPSMIDVIKEQIKLAGKELEQKGLESFEEANDFDVEEDNFYVSPYEIPEEEYEIPASVLKARAEEAANSNGTQNQESLPAGEGAEDDVSSSDNQPEAEPSRTTSSR